MRKWGTIVTVVYAAILLVVLIPAIPYIAGGETYNPAGFRRAMGNVYSEWSFWIYALILIAGQAVLLFLSVDTSRKRFKPRTHVAISCALAALLTALLTICTGVSLALALEKDKLANALADHSIALWIALWIAWALVFYLYLRDSFTALTRLTYWLLKGSVLELLIAVPCHVIVRRRGNCTDPVVTSFGIVTGVAIMLLSFGPGVLFLYKKRLDAYSDRSSTNARGANAGS